MLGVPNPQSHFANTYRDVCDSCIEFSNFIRDNFADGLFLNWRIWTFRGSKNAITR